MLANKAPPSTLGTPPLAASAKQGVKITDAESKRKVKEMLAAEEAMKVRRLFWTCCWLTADARGPSMVLAAPCLTGFLRASARLLR